MAGPSSIAWRGEHLRDGPQPGTEIAPDGWSIGQDQRRMTQAELRQLGQEPMSATAAIRAHCIDCCGGSANEVRLCLALRCPSWPWRMGTNPWRSVSEGRRESGRRLAAQRAAKSSPLKSDLRPDGGMVPATTLLPSAADRAE